MISIISAVHNDPGGMLVKTLDSIATQTFKDWELVIVDDASTDDSFRVVENFKNNFPDKVKIINNEANVGLTKSLIAAASRARGELFARIDAGDVFLAEKLKKQAEFLGRHPDIGIVGCNYVNQSVGCASKKIILPETDSQIRAAILKNNPFAHSCVLMRADIYWRAGGYDEKIRYGQDYDLWFRFIRISKAANLREVLCYRTTHPESISYCKQKAQMTQSIKTLWKYMNRRNLLNYRFYIEPVALILMPDFLKIFIRKILR